MKFSIGKEPFLEELQILQGIDEKRNTMPILANLLMNVQPNDIERPDLFILGGGASKKGESFIPNLTVRAEVLAVQFLNEAGIVGAALAAKAHLA